MEIGILHLTDIHITEQSDLDSKITSLCKVLSYDFANINMSYLVITGDIANAGKKEEYEKAKTIISKIQTYVSKRLEGLEIKIILVPGNHDCNFTLDSQVRKNSIQQIDYNMLGEDNSVLETCLSVQKDFWSFYGNYNQLPENKLSYKVTDNFENKTICFHCHNTAWMSQINEKPGTIFFPVKKFSENKELTHDINISVFHHPINWFNPNTEINNKREFQNYLDKISSIQLLGHEHETAFEKRENFDNNTNTLHFSGSILNNNKIPNESGFQIITITSSTRDGRIKRYIWNENIYSLESEREFQFNHEKTRSFSISKKFYTQINEIQVPLNINKGNSKLSDIYIFPDLESLYVDQKYIDSYLDSKSLIGNSKIKKCILEGDSQVGKTSLLRMLFLEYYNRGCYPIIINGKEIQKYDFDKVLKKKFSQIYSEERLEFDRYKQLDKNNKVLLIDDFHQIAMDLHKSQKLINQISKSFDQTIIIIDTAYGMFPQIQAQLEGFYFYAIKPFGYKKTNDLIIRFFSNQGLLHAEKQCFLQKIKHTFDQVRNVLGNKIIPSYPVFLLSILQSLENASFDLNETSYGYCYQTLIHYALANKAKVSNDDLGSYINFIKELAFYFHKNEIESISESGFVKFYTNYSNKFVFFTYDKVKQKLLSSQIIINEDSHFKFGYKYIFYFLIAKHVSDIINTEEGKNVISKLFDNLHLEINANILVFITHHTNDISFINDSLLSAMMPFDDVEAISLNRGGPYYQHINDISSEISNDIIDQNRIPEKERERQLLINDENERKSEKNSQINSVPEEINETTIPFLQAFRSIDIVGQIVKNRKGSLPKQEIIELISELYLTGFRTVGYLGTIFADAKDLLTEELKERIKDDDSREVIERKINSFFQFISLQTCLGVFTKLVYSVGIKDFKELYEEVAKQIGTPAAKLVSFSINSYYNEISTKEVSTLAKELDNNFVALQILKSRVKSYIYTNHIDYKQKQQLAQALNMKISPSIGRRKI
ncbi:MAG: metallophosphoesterase [Proteobacteria bacterium]|nr:metallophosphoesterase [Pseudomonadota bacterium]